MRAQAEEGYRVAYIELADEVVAAAGYRVAHFLAWGKVLYLDDLITHPEKSHMGFGGALMDWILEQGSELECEEVHLDTGFHRGGQVSKPGVAVSQSTTAQARWRPAQSADLNGGQGRNRTTLTDRYALRTPTKCRRAPR